MNRFRIFRARTVLVVAVPVVALIAVGFATRAPSPRQQPPAAAGHQHGSGAAITDAPQSVHLTADAARRIGVTYAVATEEYVTRDARVVGQIAVDEKRVTVVSPRVDGWVERLYVASTGQAVAAGAPLMAVYSPMIVSAQEELVLAARLAQEMTNADSAGRDRASSMLDAARRRLAGWGMAAADIARIERSGRADRLLTLRAPASGFVTEKNVIEGQRIMAGDALYRIVDLNRVWLEGDVYEQDLALVHVGQRVAADVAALPGAPINGRVEYVSPTLDPDTRTARVRIALSNADHRLKPGMVATLLLTGRAGVKTLAVPRAAVLSTGERNLVFVRRADGMLEPRVVTIGAATQDRVAILSGLVAGESVVASATFLVDAESSLGTALGGMGDMPGMDIAAPRKKE